MISSLHRQDTFNNFTTQWWKQTSYDHSMPETSHLPQSYLLKLVQISTMLSLILSRTCLLLMSHNRPFMLLRSCLHFNLRSFPDMCVLCLSSLLDLRICHLFCRPHRPLLFDLLAILQFIYVPSNSTLFSIHHFVCDVDIVVIYLELYIFQRRCK